MAVVRHRRWLVGSGALALLLFSPVMALLIEAFSTDAGLLQQLWQTVLPTYLFNSLALVTLVVIFAVLLGLPCGWLLANYQLPGHRYLEWALILPLAMPAYVVAYIYTDLLDYTGWLQIQLRDLFGWQSAADYWFPDLRTLGGAAAMLALVLYPYVYLLTRAGFLEQSINLQDAGRMLGANHWRRFFRISLPLVRPALIGAMILVAMETLADFGTVSYFAVNTLTTAITDAWLGYGSLPSAAQLSVCLISIVVLLILLEKMSRRRQQIFQKGNGIPVHNRPRLAGSKLMLSLGYCWLIVFLGFFLPVLVLLDYALSALSEQDWPALLQYSFNSLQIALAVAALAAILALPLVLTRRLLPNKPGVQALQIAGIGYAMPGTVLAIGILIPFTLGDFLLNDVIAAFGWQEPGLILTGTIFALVCAYVVRFIAIALGSQESSLARISFSLDMVSRSLGYYPLPMFARVHLPLMWRGIMAGIVLIFIESMKELPAALLLRPFNFETLPTIVYQYVKTEQLQLGALPALMIVLVGLLPLIFFTRSLERGIT